MIRKVMGTLASPKLLVVVISFTRPRDSESFFFSSCVTCHSPPYTHTHPSTINIINFYSFDGKYAISKGLTKCPLSIKSWMLVMLMRESLVAGTMMMGSKAAKI